MTTSRATPTETDRKTFPSHLVHFQTRILTKESYIHSKEPYIHSKKPCLHSKEPYIHSKEPYIIPKNPYKTFQSHLVHVHLGTIDKLQTSNLTKESDIHSKEPYIHLKEPYIHSKEPYKTILSHLAHVHLGAKADRKLGRGKEPFLLPLHGPFPPPARDSLGLLAVHCADVLPPARSLLGVRERESLRARAGACTRERTREV